MKPVEIHSAARAELDDASAFYESHAEGLGLDLVEKVAEAVARVRLSPEAWPPHKRSRFRKLFTERFPFTVFYLDLPDCIWIVAIAHASRRPDYWMERRREREA